MAEVERTWTAFARRFGLTVDAPIKQMAEWLLPVVQAATPDYTDAERSLYVGGVNLVGDVANHTAAEFNANVSCSLVSTVATSLTSPIRLFSDQTATTYTNNLQQNRRSAVQPQGRRGRCNILGGTSSNTPPTNELSSQIGFSTAPLVLAALENMIFNAGERFVVQAVNQNTTLSVLFVWRELEF